MPANRLPLMRPSATDGLSRLEQLEAWLAEHVGEVMIADLATPIGTGYSNETLLFTASFGGGPSRHLVARIGLTGEGLFPENDVPRQRRVMSAVRAHSSVAVPEVLWWDDAPTAFGAPFFIMERVAGRIPPDDPKYTVAGWVAELTADERRRLNDGAISELAKIHAVDWRTADLGQLRRPGTSDSAIEREIAHLARYYRWAGGAGASVPSIDAAFRWVEAHRPPRGSDKLVLNWGDARIENMVFDADMNVRAVLDWEMASINPPELDLAWWLFALRYCTDGIGVSTPAGLYDVDTTVARYAELSGHEPRHLPFFEVLATIDAAIICLRIAGRYKQSGVLPPESDADTNNGATHLLCAHLGLPAPGPTPVPFTQ